MVSIRPLKLLSAVLAGLLVALTAVTTGLAQEAIHLTINGVDSSNFPSVVSSFTVTGASGLPIKGLDEGVFAVSENDRPVTSFSIQEVQAGGEPITVILAIDTSGSMSASAIDESGNATTALANTKLAASAFVEALGPSDQIGLVTFSDEATQAVPLTQDRQIMSEAMAQLQAEGETALYDAVVASVGMLKDLPAGRKAVILLADGANNSSTFSFDEAINEAARWSIPVYPIGFGKVNQPTMEKIAALTGGYAQIKPDSSELSLAFETVLGLLRHQYLIDYTSSSPADGTELSITVTLNYLGAQVQDSRTFIARPGEVLVRMPSLSDGDVVGGNVRLAPEILAPGRVSELTLTLDGAPLATLTAEPFEYSWDSTGVGIGDHSLLLVAKDDAGNSGSLELRLIVRPPIIIEWVGLADGSEITGPETLEVSVDSLSGVAGVEFYANDKLLGTVTEPPYQLEWSLEGIEPGEHMLRVVAVDLNNRTAEEQLRVIVSLQNLSVIFVVAAIILIGAAVVGFPLATRRRKRMVLLSGRTEAPVQGGKISQPVVLREVEGLQPGQVWELGAEETKIGRKKNENDIQAAGRSASRRHALITQSEGHYVLHDLNPANPTYVNGQPVHGQQTLALGDMIRIGESEFKLEADDRD